MVLTKPGNFVSPYVRGAFDVHVLNHKEEDDVLFPSTGTDVLEISATAIGVAAGFGGIITIKESVFISLEGRILYASVGDSEVTATGPGAAGFQDTTDTEASVWSTDMVIGFRVLFL